VSDDDVSDQNFSDQPATELGWHHYFQGGPGTLTLLLLHGTGGDEHQLTGLARQVAPTAGLLGVRGRSLDEGFPRFFRRFDAVTYDQEQLASEADALAAFGAAASERYGIEPGTLVALGYSNGANIALATLLRNPGAFAGAALLRPVMALAEPPTPDLSGTPVLVLSGQRDPYSAHADDIAPHLRGCGADVEEHLLPAGHELTEGDLVLLDDWLSALGRVPSGG